MILIIDNGDSFVHNLARYCRELGQETRIIRNTALSLDDIKILDPGKIILSPGFGFPAEAGICLSLVHQFAGKIPLLGISLGHHVIGQAFGMQVKASGTPVHGKASEIHHNNSTLFRNIPDGFRGGRYHSLILEKKALPDMIEVSAWTDDHTIMAIEIKGMPIFGVQFNPESVLTEYGHKLLENFINVTH